MTKTLSELRQRTTVWLCIACAYHMVLAFGTMVAIWHVNLPNILPDPAAIDLNHLWLNSGLMGLLGSLLYFSRKAYVYLITDKVGRIFVEAQKSKVTVEREESELDVSRSQVNGYLLYLFMRPLAGVAIGPLLVMTILAGLSTIGRGEVSPKAISPTGIVLVLVFSFIGGYKSSDMFDHFSQMGSKFIKKSE